MGRMPTGKRFPGKQLPEEAEKKKKREKKKKQGAPQKNPALSKRGGKFLIRETSKTILGEPNVRIRPTWEFFRKSGRNKKQKKNKRKIQNGGAAPVFAGLAGAARRGNNKIKQGHQRYVGPQMPAPAEARPVFMPSRKKTFEKAYGAFAPLQAADSFHYHW